MQDSFLTYVIALVVVLAAIFVIKKVAGCLVRTIVFLIAAAIIVALVLHAMPS